MTHHQTDLIKRSWAMVRPMAAEAGQLFYQKLFAAAPAIRHLFKPDISPQANKLMQVLGYVVSKLDRMDELVPEVQKLGARHNEYGAQPAHYELVGQCLIATLKEGLGEHWNPEVQDAWVTAYNTLKNVMIVAQEDAKLEPLLQAS
ncbi:MAG TPA: globin family protein [Phnomibacter sp.]|nr:globin family protein [Phnomibacter sp.]